MAEQVIHVDLEEWLCRAVRERLRARPEPECRSITWVGNRRRNKPPTGDEVHVVIRDDSGPRRDLVVQDARVGFSVLGESKASPERVKTVARILQVIVALLPDAEPGNPVARVSQQLGPYWGSEESNLALAYQTAEIAVVGIPFD